MASSLDTLMDRWARERGIVRKAVNVPADVDSVGNRTQPRDEGGRFVSSQYSTDAEGQVFKPSSDQWSNADTEAARTHGLGSIVQSVLDRGGQSNVASYPSHTLAGAIMEAAVRHKVTVYGGSTDTVAAQYDSPRTLVGEDHDSNPQVFAAFQAAVNRMSAAFRAATGRVPTFGASTNPDDLEFARAYAALRERFWPSGIAPDNDPDDTGNIQ